MEACCKQCGKPLTRDEIGLHKKMVNRGATEYFCLECLAKYFGAPPDLLKEKIEQFRKDGCTLFL